MDFDSTCLQMICRFSNVRRMTAVVVRLRLFFLRYDFNGTASGSSLAVLQFSPLIPTNGTRVALVASSEKTVASKSCTCGAMVNGSHLSSPGKLMKT